MDATGSADDEYEGVSVPTAGDDGYESHADGDMRLSALSNDEGEGACDEERDAELALCSSCAC